MNYRIWEHIRFGLETLLYADAAGAARAMSPEGSFLAGSLPDMFIPLAAYAGCRALFLQEPSPKVARGIAVGGALMELGQLIGIVPGTYDIHDIPMYLLGAGLAYFVDALRFNYEQTRVNLFCQDDPHPLQEDTLKLLQAIPTEYEELPSS